MENVGLKTIIVEFLHPTMGHRMRVALASIDSKHLSFTTPEGLLFTVHFDWCYLCHEVKTEFMIGQYWVCSSCHHELGIWESKFPAVDYEDG